MMTGKKSHPNIDGKKKKKKKRREPLGAGK